MCSCELGGVQPVKLWQVLTLFSFFKGFSQSQFSPKTSKQPFFWGLFFFKLSLQMFPNATPSASLGIQGPLEISLI